jgi:hypothetical protein
MVTTTNSGYFILLFSYCIYYSLKIYLSIVSLWRCDNIFLSVHRFSVTATCGQCNKLFYGYKLRAKKNRLYGNLCILLKHAYGGYYVLLFSQSDIIALKIYLSFVTMWQHLFVCSSIQCDCHLWQWNKLFYGYKLRAKKNRLYGNLCILLKHAYSGYYVLLFSQSVYYYYGHKNIILDNLCQCNIFPSV